MITKYTDFINEKLILEFNASIFGLSDIPDLFTRLGYDKSGAGILSKLIRNTFKNSGDQGVIDTLKKSFGVEVFNVSKGKYSFEPYSVAKEYSVTETIKEDIERERKKEEKKYLSKKEIERMTEPQRRAAVHRRKELGSINDDDLKESIVDKMKPKSEDDIFFKLSSKTTNLVYEHDFDDSDFKNIIKIIMDLIGSDWGEMKLIDEETNSGLYDSIYDYLLEYVKDDDFEYKTIDGYEFKIYKDKQVVFSLADFGELDAIMFDIHLGRKNN